MSVNEETRVWSGTSSQKLNLGTYVLCGLLSPLVIPIFIALWKFLLIKNTRYELTTQRLKLHHGVLSKFTDDIELYRVKDTRLERPFSLRVLGLGNVIIATSDASNPVIVMRGLVDAEGVREKIRLHAEQTRDAKGVREIDFSDLPIGSRH
ncbi:MAG: PH domain-containing protein [Myxococcales bacterium]|nr:PH domain-containing protein [Myxococcales bacterium]